MQERIARIIRYPRAPHTDDILKRILLDTEVYGYWMPEQSIHIRVLIVAEIFSTDGRDLCEIRPVFAHGEYGNPAVVPASEIMFTKETA